MIHMLGLLNTSSEECWSRWNPLLKRFYGRKGIEDQSILRRRMYNLIFIKFLGRIYKFVIVKCKSYLNPLLDCMVLSLCVCYVEVKPMSHLFGLMTRIYMNDGVVIIPFTGG